MTSKRLWIWIVAVTVLYFALSVTIGSPKTSTQMPVGSSYSPAPEGSLGLFQLFDRTPARGSTRILLEPETGYVHTREVLFIEPGQDDSSQTVAAWLALAKRGERLIELSDRQTPLMTLLHLQLVPSSPKHGAGSGLLTLSGVGAPRSARQTWPVSVVGQIPGLLGARPTDRVWKLSSGHGVPQTVGITRTVGAGQISILTLPQLTYNAGIGKADNLGPLLTLLRPTQFQVGFDETIHGYALTPGTLTVLGRGVTAAFWILALAAILWLWSEGKRFGRPSRPRPEPRSATLEMAEALAKHYVRETRFDSLLSQLAVHAERGAPPRELAARPADAARKMKAKAFVKQTNEWVATIREQENHPH